MAGWRTVGLAAALVLVPGPFASGTAPGNDLAGTSAPEAIDLAIAGHAALRAGRPADARRLYLEAAGQSPEVADWLLLRSAELTSDSVQRHALFTRLTTAVARSRITATEAVVRERAGDLPGAIIRYDSLGRAADALRLRLRLAKSGPERVAVRAALDSMVQRHAADGETRRAVELLLASFTPLTAHEALGVARAAARLRQFTRAAAHYPRGLTSTGATAHDHLSYGESLRRAGRPREAIDALGRVRGAPAVRAAAELERARAQVKLGDRAGALATVDRLVERYPGDAGALPEALLLGGMLRWETEGSAPARETFLELARRVPGSELAPRARFLAALAAWESGLESAAADEWERLRRDTPRSDAGAAAGYWSGRARERLGDHALARSAWAAVKAQDTLSYYGVAAARRLGIQPWTPAAAPDSFAPVPDVDSAVTRLDLLVRMAMSAEVGWEQEWLVGRAGESPERGLATADAFRRAAQPAIAVRLARRAVAGGAPGDARAYRLMYPLPRHDELRALAETEGVDPLLVAALVRQESAWDPRATSAAGARGLMQVMPPTGAALARKLAIKPWHADSLYDAALNLRLGIVYLAEAVRRHNGDLPSVLAAYNAGPSRVTRWTAQFGGEDRDLWIERIPFTETRDYVRTIQRNLAVYRSLYTPAL
jgi:soluble lytic murein transglycosylase